MPRPIIGDRAPGRRLSSEWLLPRGFLESRARRVGVAKNIFKENTRVAAPTLVRRIVAALSFDSFTSAPAFGTRSGQTETRQLLFSAQGNDIDVHVSPQSEGWAISGQVLGAPIADIKDAAVLLQGASLSETAELNDLSEFSFPPVPPGSYKLNLRLGDVEVELPEIGLGL